MRHWRGPDKAYTVCKLYIDKGNRMFLFNKMKHINEFYEFCESTVVIIFHVSFPWIKWQDATVKFWPSLHCLIFPHAKNDELSFFLTDFFLYKSQCIIISQHRNYNLSNFWNIMKSLVTQIIFLLDFYVLCTGIQG